MLTTRPKPRAAMPRNTTWFTFSGPNRLMATTLRQNSGVVSRKLCARSHPALLTRKATGPTDASKSSTARATASQSVMSRVYRLARPPAALISPTNVSPLAVSRSRIPTAPPSSARRRAIAAPIPFAPPVTRTVRSFSPRMSAPQLRSLHRVIAGGATRQHPSCLVAHHNFISLVLHVDPGNDDAAIAFRGGPHRRHLDLPMNGVTDAYRSQHVLLELEHGKAGALDHTLAQQPLDEAIGQRGRHELPLDRTLLATEGSIDEDGFQHPRHTREQDEVGLGKGPVECSKALAGGKLLPREPEPERLHRSVSIPLLRMS